ncbi:hypothetical protein GCM10010985_25170 [Caballeronia grimmiae]|uniref:Secreted protein n=1 Tax=Caballeronia grimmiae TaxID=1071679 RepID=A0ABQ1RKF5_9BURK|nr:hypothetical protein GCM10010985_25170 [Caballeronia grimmiae]
MFVWNTTDVDLRAAVAVLAVLLSKCEPSAWLCGMAPKQARLKLRTGIGRCLASCFDLALLRGLLVAWLSCVWPCDAGAATTERCFDDSDDGYCVGLGGWLVLYLANENSNDSIRRETWERELGVRMKTARRRLNGPKC